MERYDTRIEDDTLYLETGEGALEVGPMSAVLDLLGETYTIEYDEEARTVGWLSTDEDGTISFDVRETIDGLDFEERFVGRVASAPLDRTPSEGYPERTVAFADLLREIWDSKGSFEFE